MYKENLIMEKKQQGNESSVEKALNILSAYANQEQEMGVTSISVLLGIHKSTTARLIKSLVATGFLQQNPINKKYFLGRAAHQIGQQAMHSHNNRIIGAALPYLQKLSHDTGETTALEQLSGYNIFLSFHVEGPSHLRFIYRQGELVPINVSVGAKSILAYASEEFLDICLQQKLERFNQNTVTDIDEYRKVLEKVREEGVAFDRGEHYQEIQAIGAPIRIPGKTPESAIVITGPASRMTDTYLQSLRQPITKTAKAIATTLQNQEMF